MTGALQVRLDDDQLERLADLFVERVASRKPADPWLTSAQAAEHLGITVTALDKHCAARRVPFPQDRPGGKRWSKASQLDQWRQS